MKSSRPDKDKQTEDDIIKDAKNHFRPKKEIDCTTIKDVRHHS